MTYPATSSASSFFLGALGSVLLTVALLMPGCATNPATGRTQLDFLTREEEIRLGAEAAPEFIEQNGGVIPDEGIQRYVSDLGMRLAAISEYPELPWRFRVLNTEVINAFALPGGKVFITRGMLAQMDNEAQLAGVLGHEIGHVTARHTDERMSRAMIIQGTAVAAGAAAEIADEDWLRILGVGVAVGGTGFQLKFSRDQESEADMLGLRYMTELGYNPRGQVQVMEILKSAGGASWVPEFLLTHPLPETRIDRLGRLIDRKYPQANDAGVYDYGERSFEQNVLEPLADLPPAPKQRQQQQAARSPATGHAHVVAPQGTIGRVPHLAALGHVCRSPAVWPAHLAEKPAGGGTQNKFDGPRVERQSCVGGVPVAASSTPRVRRGFADSAPATRRTVATSQRSLDDLLGRAHGQVH